MTILVRTGKGVRESSRDSTLGRIRMAFRRVHGMGGVYECIKKGYSLLLYHIDFKREDSPSRDDRLLHGRHLCGHHMDYSSS